MQSIEQQYYHTNQRLIREMQILLKESRKLVTHYKRRRDRLTRRLLKQEATTTENPLNFALQAALAKKGLLDAFEIGLLREMEQLQALYTQPFQPEKFQQTVMTSHKKIIIWANKVLSKQAPKEIRHHYRPFREALKKIAEAILPANFQMSSLVKNVLHRTFFFKTKNQTQKLATRTLARMQKAEKDLPFLKNNVLPFQQLGGNTN